MYPNILNSVVMLALCSIAFSANDPNTARKPQKKCFYVSTCGDDGADGTLERPFKTLERAKLAVGSVKWKQMSGEIGNIDVLLRAGRYYFIRPVIFTENDSSNYGYKITYRNYSKEDPVLIGGVPVTGWEKYKKNIYRTQVPFLKGGLIEFYQIFENGEAAVPARSPNQGWFRMVKPEYKSIHYRSEDFDLTGSDAGMLRVGYVERGTYFSSYRQVLRTDPARHIIELIERPYYPFNPETDNGNLYFIENSLQFLDMPGEFFADTKSGYLYYWPRAKDINKTEIVIPMVDSIMKFEAYSWQYPVHDIVIQGLELQDSRTSAAWHNGWNECGENGNLNEPQPELGINAQLGAKLDETDRSSVDASYNWGLIRIDKAEKISIKDCRLLNSGMHGVSLCGASVKNEITGCEIVDAGASGIRLRGQPSIYRPSDARTDLDINHDNIIHNNYIHHCGRLYIQGCGVLVGNSGKNIISNNRFADLADSGVLLFSQWNIPRKLTTMNGNVIKNNEFIRCGNQVWDLGFFYIGASCNDTTVENNLFIDAWSWTTATWPTSSTRPDDLCMIDFDPGQCYNTQIRNNMFYGIANHMMEIGRSDESIFINNFWENRDKVADNIKYEIANYYGGKTPDFIASGFDPAKVDMHFGLTSEYKFAYPVELARPLKLPVRSSFEGTLSPMYLYRYSGGPGRNYISSAHVHSGTAALNIDKDVCLFRYRHPEPVSAKISIWMYDNTSKDNAQAFVFVRNADPRLYPFQNTTAPKTEADPSKQNADDRGVNRITTSPSECVNMGWFTSPDDTFAAVGVYGRISKSRYVLCIDGHPAQTSVKRSEGWHQIQFDLSNPGKGCIVRFDNKDMGYAPGLKQFNIVDAGDPDFGTDSTGICFDDFSVE
jgi:hypothetical protein